MKKEDLKKIPGVDALLQSHEVQKLISSNGSQIVKHFIREHLNEIRKNITNNCPPPSEESIIKDVTDKIKLISGISLKRVINATGIILNTNIGRGPLGKFVADEVYQILTGYSNLEFDLKTGKRSKRVQHVSDILRYLTGAEDAVVVNNNAAAVLLIMKIFADKHEIIISRGELVEIGGSFRTPDIIKASGARMVEAGTTNRTNLNDYKNAITPETRILLKVHKSNYSVHGFTEETGITELAKLAHENDLLLVYDIGSGLLNSEDLNVNVEEPSVRQSISSGVDLITFSCDKLLGGPQAGIIAGKRELVQKIAKDPLIRTYRVDKIILAALSSVLRLHLNEKERNEKLPVYRMLTKSKDELKSAACRLMTLLKNSGINSEVIESEAYCGGGTLPDHKISSYSVRLNSPDKRKDFAQKIYSDLLRADTPVIAILKSGQIYFDVLTLTDEDIKILSEETTRITELRSVTPQNSNKLFDPEGVTLL